MTDGLSMDRDPAPDAQTPHAGEAPGAQPLTDILLTPPARASKPPTPPVVEAPAAGRPDDRRRRGVGPSGDDDPGRLPDPGHRHADPVLRREPHAGQRLPGVRRRGHRLARPRPRLLAGGRGRDGGPDRLRAGPAVAQDGPRIPGLLGGPVAWPGPIAPDGSIGAYAERYGADATRYGPPAAPAAPGERDAQESGHHHAPAGDAAAATVAQPTKVDNNLYVRDYAKCILCYKCVDACGEEAQNTFAIAVAGRGFDARISTEGAVPLPESACVYCGNCIGVCPTGALMFKSEYDMREAGTWDESVQTVTETICPYCGVGCAVELHAQDDRIVKVTSPSDSSVTDGHLCIKGRFGFEFVNNRPPR